jgi:hypothetical protein
LLGDTKFPELLFPLSDRYCTLYTILRCYARRTDCGQPRCWYVYLYADVTLENFHGCKCIDQIRIQFYMSAAFYSN